jgi:hypothetical protein
VDESWFDTFKQLILPFLVQIIVLIFESHGTCGVGKRIDLSISIQNFILVRYIFRITRYKLGVLPSPKTRPKQVFSIKQSYLKLEMSKLNAICGIGKKKD